MMSMIIALVVGTVIGWGASVLKETDGLEDLTRNVIFGAIGAFTGGWMLTAIFDSIDATNFHVGIVLASMLGAAIAVFIVNRLREA